MVYPAQHDCSLRCREVLPQAGIVDWASSSVYLDTVIFQYYAIANKYRLYITNDTNDIFVMGECDLYHYLSDKKPWAGIHPAMISRFSKFPIFQPMIYMNLS